MIPAEQLELHRSAIAGHCYRMMGSPADADDAVQETMVRAWRNLEKLDPRAPVKAWLYKISTNVCLDMIGDKKRRARPIEDGPQGTPNDELMTLARSHWLEPVPDAWALPKDADPSELLVLRQSNRLAFVAALQHLPPKQRAVLLLIEVLGWSANEVAEGLELTVASVNSALQRARATLGSRNLKEGGDPLTDAQTKLVDRYLDAFVRYDVPALVSLLHHDATLSMPPYTLWLQGHDQISTWLLGRGADCRGSRLIPTMASGMPAFGQYRIDPGGGFAPWALLVVEVKGDRLSSMCSFLDTQNVFPRFGLPLHLDA